MNVAGQPLMDHAELARGAARSPAAARSAAAHGSVCIHEPLQEREPLGNGSVQVPFRGVLVPEDADLAEFRPQRYWPLPRPPVQPATTALAFIVVLAQTSRDDISAG